MLTEPAGENQWRALVRPGRKVAIGERLVFPRPRARSRSKPRCWSADKFGERLIEFAPGHDDFFAVLDDIGHMPLPPYIRRDDADADRERYQTCLPTSADRWPRPRPGCTLRRRCSRRSQPAGVEIARVTLHVGLGTFAPLRVERVDEVRLHRERYTIERRQQPMQSTAPSREGRRIVAVGTTVVRTLESAALAAGGEPIYSRIPARRRSLSRPASSFGWWAHY